MNSLLITVAAFGVGGIVLNTALQGLLLVAVGRDARPGSRVLFGVVTAGVLVVLPVLAATDLLRTVPEAGFAEAFGAASAVALLVYGSTLAVSALLASRVAPPSTDTAGSGPSAPLRHLGGLGACVLVGLLAAGVALLLT